MATHIFLYGSLLHPDSLRRTLPAVDPDQAVGARLTDHVRTFDVAFPNDGSQPDKAYFDDDDHRPPYVLFANVVPVAAATTTAADSSGPVGTVVGGAEAPVAGVVIPLHPGYLARLQARERRYGLCDISAYLTPFGGSGTALYDVATFVGLPQFTRAEHAARGLVSREYLATIEAGAAFWDTRLPGFAQAYRAGTRLPDAKAVADLRRVDSDAAHNPAHHP